MVIEPTWASEDDSFNVFYEDADPAVITGADISLDVYVPQEYVTDKKTAFMLFFLDVNGEYANVGYRTAEGLTGDAYNTFAITNLGATNGTAFGTINDNFDLTKVDTFGLQVNANKKPTTVTGDLMIDNVVLTLAEDKETPDGTGPLPMTTGWRANPSSIVWSYVADGVTFVPAYGTGTSAQVVSDITLPADFNNHTFTVTYEIDQAFVDSSSLLQVFVQEKNGYSVFQYCNADSSTVGEHTLGCPVTKSIPAGAEGFQVGVQVSGGTPAGNVIIKSAIISVSGS